MIHKWTITSLWNGELLPPENHVHIQMEVGPNGDLTVQIDAAYYDEPAPTEPPDTLWRLWDHEVIEVFLVGADGHYLEAEFGPHGHHLLLQLSGPREIVDRFLPVVEYGAQINGDRWQGRAVIASKYVPDPICQFNLFAISGIAPDRRYMSWGALPGDGPDFHQAERFPQWPGA